MGPMAGDAEMPERQRIEGTERQMAGEAIAQRTLDNEHSTEQGDRRTPRPGGGGGGGNGGRRRFTESAAQLHDSIVSKNPRSVYLNYRDLDIGTSTNGKNSYGEGPVYVVKYFNDNFERLVKVKTAVDPTNFFMNE
ncbi:hypothetical protein NL676_012312 [Syzygium grande]|nr:hypothetical protein NL676_012312 [Syzygium grande]